MIEPKDERLGRLRPEHHNLQILIYSLMIAAGPLFAEVRTMVRDGRPVVDGVFVNGHGPYRFLLDTGANVNLIETGIAREIGMVATFHVELASSAGRVATSGSDGNWVALDFVRADEQKFLFSELEAIHGTSPDVQGVLGEWFLAQFDYTLDMRGKRIEFGMHDRRGTRTAMKMINGRPAISTSLGVLVLDSGANRLVLFNAEGGGSSHKGFVRTLTGSQAVRSLSRSLSVGGRRFWSGDAVVVLSQTEPGVDGLLPIVFFKVVYICNSEGYAVIE